MYIKYTKCSSCCLVLIYCKATGLEMKEFSFGFLYSNINQLLQRKTKKIYILSNMDKNRI